MTGKSRGQAADETAAGKAEQPPGSSSNGEGEAAEKALVVASPERKHHKVDARIATDTQAQIATLKPCRCMPSSSLASPFSLAYTLRS